MARSTSKSSGRSKDRPKSRTRKSRSPELRGSSPSAEALSTAPVLEEPKRPLVPALPPATTPTDSSSVGERAPVLANGHVALKRCRHGWFMYNVNDRFIGRSLDRYGEWCESELALLAPLLRPGRVVIDVGANIGTHTIFFANKVGDRGRVYAFEPQRPTFQLLCGNVALNALINVVALPYAVGREDGDVRIAVADPRVPNNFGGMSVTALPNGEETRIVRIDTLDLPRCDLIKIDVEGMEADVLAGARATIEKFRPVIYCENNNASPSARLIEALDEMRYRTWWHIENYYNPGNFFGERENIFAGYAPEANMFCTPPEAKIVVQNLEPVSGPDDDWRKAYRRILERRGV